MFSEGAGAESRIALGTAVVFGMAVNAVVGTLFVPNFWELLERFRQRHLEGIFNPDQSKKTLPPSSADNNNSENIQ